MNAPGQTQGPELNGYYINLDRSESRRLHMEQQVRRVGLPWIQRFAAIDGRTLDIPPNCALSAGGLACFLSHQRIIESTPPDSYTFIFEDDVELSLDLPIILNEQFYGIAAGYDMVFLDCQPDSNTALLATLWQALRDQVIEPADLERFDGARRLRGVSLLHAPDLYRWGLSSYIVTPRGHRRMPPVLKECLDRGPPGQLDILLQHALADGRLNGMVVAPFLATPLLDSHETSTIDARPQANDVLRLTAAIRRMFYAGEIGDVGAWVGAFPDHPNPNLRTLAALSFQVMLRQADNTFSVDP